MQVLEFMLFAEYFQFYIQDGETDETLPVHWEPEQQEDMIIIGEQIIGVGTVRELDIAITVEIADGKPDDEENLDEWSHVVECSIALPSGKLLCTGTSEDLYESQRVTLPAGVYGARVYYASLDQVDAEGFEGEDHYKVRLWKTDEPPANKILKRWAAPSLGGGDEELLG